MPSAWCVAVEEPKGPLRVLMIFDEGPDLRALDLIEEGFESTFQGGTTRRVELYHEYLDASRFRDSEHHSLFADYLRVKYGEMELALVVPIIGARTEWASRIPRELFPSVPIVFGACMSSGAGSMPLISDMTGVMFLTDVLKGVETALVLRPRTRRVVVVAGPEGMYPDLIGRIVAAEGRYPDVVFEYWTDRSASQILESAAALPQDTTVFYIELFRDAEGASFVPWEFGRELAASASVPVFGIFESYLDTGIVGGAVVSFSSLGSEAAKKALRIINGESSSDIPVQNSPSAVQMFDWRALRRWGIPMSNLPENSIVRFCPPPLWETYRTMVVTGVTWIIVLMVSLLALITQLARRRRVEVKLRENEASLSLAVELGGVGLWSLNLVTGRFWLTPIARAMVGLLNDDEMDIERFIAAVHPEDRDLIRQTIEEMTQRRQSVRIEYRIVLLDGSVRWIVSRGRAYSDPIASDGQSFLMGVSVDVTEQKARAAALAQQQAFTESLINGLPGIFYLYDDKWQLIRWNENHQTVTGFSREEMLNRHVLEWFSSSYKEKVANTVRKVFEEGSGALEASLLLKDGSEVPYVFNGVCIEEAGESYFLGMGIDISGRVEKEQALRQSESQLQLITEAMPTMIAHVDSDQRYLFVNQRYSDFVGMSREEIVGKRIQEVMGDDDYDVVREHVETVLSGRCDTYESIIHSSDSTRQIMQAVYVPDLEGNTVRGFFASIHDVTELTDVKADNVRARNELAHVSRVMTMGELATSLAHELNQPLTAILSNSQSGLKLSQQENPDIKEIEDICRDNVADSRRAADVIQRLRTFLQRDSQPGESLDLNAVIGGVLDILHSEVVIQGLTIETDLSADLPRVQADRVQLEQVFINLIVNAEQAMNANQMGTQRLVIKTFKDDDGAVVTYVQDDGPGIPKETLEGIFDPFVSTKADGMGMGLAISRSIIERNAGKLWAENVPGSGARFYMLLPAEDCS